MPPQSPARRKAKYARSCVGRRCKIQVCVSQSDHESSDEEIIEDERQYSLCEVERQIRCDKTLDFLYEQGLEGLPLAEAKSGIGDLTPWWEPAKNQKFLHT